MSIINNWDRKFISLSEHISQWSKDRSTKVGAVIVDSDNRVISTGYNGFPAGLDDDIDERHLRPAKYKYTEHAERNAIYSAARIGSSTKGCSMYLQWFPCSDCARAIIQSGVKRIVCKRPDFENKNWGEDFRFSIEMLEECNINIDYYD